MNLPNKLSVLRICLIPFVMFFYLADFIPYGIGKIIAIVIFIAAALTDMLDGKIARKHNLVTNLGKFLDPIADKILTAAVFFLILADGTLPAPWGVIIVTVIIAREFMVSALRQLAANKGIVLAADKWGKAKTMIQMIALPMCMLLAFVNVINVAEWLLLSIEMLSYILIGLATLLTIVSGANYMIKNKDCFKDSK